MRTLNIIKNLSRGTVLVTLLFRLFVMNKLHHNWNVISYNILAVCLVSMVILEALFFYIKKRKND